MKRANAAILLALISTASQAVDSNCASRTSGGKHTTWSGACKEGYPEGPGLLEQKEDGVLRFYYEGNVHRGVPHGKGYAKTSDGAEYEGDFVSGKREGQGVYASEWGNRYEGSFRDNKPHGEGTIEYALGGSYKGQWKDGKPHGKGTAVYAGGRRVEGDFLDGELVGESRVKIAASTPRYALRVAPRKIGMVGERENVFGSVVPYHKSYAELSEQEKVAVRAAWPMLDAGDTPPYPLHGTREMFEWLSKAQNERLVSGDLMMKVMIDSQGRATAVQVLASPDEALTKFAAAVLMKQQYSPALCQGTPCAMAYPFGSRLTIGRPAPKR